MLHEPEFPIPSDSPAGGRCENPPRPESAPTAGETGIADDLGAAGGAAADVSAAPVGVLPGVLEWTGSDVDSFQIAARQVDPTAETVVENSPSSFVRTASNRSVRTAAAGSPTIDAQRRPSLLLIGLISYASAATLALMYLYYAWSQPRSLELESLPDVPPLDVERGEVMKLAPVDADLPVGHQLALGESRRFGNILVEPLRVVAEPVTFEHFSGQTSAVKPPTGTVLKLWVRFTNVSDTQRIAPLDADLLFRRAVLDDGVARANQFVCRASERSSAEALVLMFDHPITSEWDLTGQRLGVPLEPGESVETYVPSSEAGSVLSGPLVWRLHFRKGYSPRGYGVTTLVDVVFDSSDVEISGASG